MRKQSAVEPEVEIVEAVIQEKSTKAGAKHKRFRRCILVLAITGLLVMMISQSTGVSLTDSGAMYPQIREGDLLMIDKLNHDYAIGDVIQYKQGELMQIGRISARNGDSVSFSPDGHMSVNGNLQTDDVYTSLPKITINGQYPVTVPAGAFFVMCDNRAIAMDSRSFGCIQANQIIGKVTLMIRHSGI